MFTFLLQCLSSSPWLVWTLLQRLQSVQPSELSKHIDLVIVAFVWSDCATNEDSPSLSAPLLYELSCIWWPCSGFSRWIQPLVKRPDYHGRVGEEEPFCHRFGGWCVAICQLQQQPWCCQIQLPGVQGGNSTWIFTVFNIHPRLKYGVLYYVVTQKCGLNTFTIVTLPGFIVSFKCVKTKNQGQHLLSVQMQMKNHKNSVSVIIDAAEWCWMGVWRSRFPSAGLSFTGSLKNSSTSPCTSIPPPLFWRGFGRFIMCYNALSAMGWSSATPFSRTNSWWQRWGMLHSMLFYWTRW